jgi:hypothetical protein
MLSLYCMGDITEVPLYLFIAYTDPVGVLYNIIYKYFILDCKIYRIIEKCYIGYCPNLDLCIYLLLSSTFKFG